MSKSDMPKLPYLANYPEELKAQVRQLLTEDRLGEILKKKYPARHDIRTDKALYDYVLEVKTRFMRSTEPLSKVVFDNSLQCWNEYSLIQSTITTPTERGNMSTMTFETLELTDALKKQASRRNKPKRW